MAQQTNKPVLFISHASSDSEFTNVVKREIERVFDKKLGVFSTSSPGAIRPGDDWLGEVEHQLGLAKAVIAIVTPISIERPWLWFEIGATWANGRSGECRIYPLCAPEVSTSDLPAPLDRLQALSMGKMPDIRALFEALIEQFGFGKISSLKARNISGRIPKYQDVKVSDIDINERPLYSGAYSGYSDEELMEVIESDFFENDHDDMLDSLPSIGGHKRKTVRSGKLIHFRRVDASLGLPPGTAKRLLNKVAEARGLLPLLEHEHVVRYGPRDRF